MFGATESDGRAPLSRGSNKPDVPPAAIVSIRLPALLDRLGKIGELWAAALLVFASLSFPA